MPNWMERHKVPWFQSTRYSSPRLPGSSASRHLHPIDGNVLYGPLRFGGRDLCFFWKPGLLRWKALSVFWKTRFQQHFWIHVEVLVMWNDIYIYHIKGLFRKQNTTIHGGCFLCRDVSRRHDGGTQRPEGLYWMNDCHVELLNHLILYFHWYSIGNLPWPW